MFVYLIGQASHADDFKYKGMTLNRGQYVRSYRKLADDLSYKEGRGYKKYSLNTIKRCVNKLIESERVNVKETELGTLFTIVNYAKYQQNEATSSESENGSLQEVRTNRELMENEGRTNGEQYQELKNLRTKELNTTTTTNTREVISDAIVFYQENFGSITPHVSNDLLVWLDDLGDELVIEAMQRAVERNKRNWGYVKSILQSWLRKNIRTIEQAKAEEVEFQNQQKSRFSKGGYNQKPTVVPDWFKDRKQPEEPKQESQEDEQARADMQALLSKYANE